MVQRYQKCYRGTYFNDAIYIALFLSQHSIDNGNFCHIVFSKYTIIDLCKVGENFIGSYKDITHEMNTTIFTNSRKCVSGFTPGVFQCVYFELFISFIHYFGIIIKQKCSPFNQDIIEQPIMSINKVYHL